MTEEQFLIDADPDELWVYDKLIVSRKLGYVCGPVGISVPKPNWYIVRPVMNILGLGLGTQKLYLEGNTDSLTPGHFWCEFFIGRHISVDYYYGEPVLAVEGIKDNDSFVKWNKWIKINELIKLPEILINFKNKEWINCEFINGNLIEIHFRNNPDFFNRNINEYIPVWTGENTTPPLGYSYITDPDIHGRIGAFIK